MTNLNDVPPPIPSPRAKNKTNLKWIAPISAVLIGAGILGFGFAGNNTGLFGFGAKPAVYTLAVGAFADNGETPENVTRILNDLFYTSLDGTKKFTLVERGRMADLYKEYLRTLPDEAPDKAYGETSSKKSLEDNERIVANNILHKMNKLVMEEGSSASFQKENGEIKEIGATGRMGQEDLIKIRTLTKADYFLVGVISDFYSDQYVKESDSLGRQSRRSALSMTLDARIINTKTGEIVSAPTVCIERPKVTATAGNAISDRLEKLEMEVAREATQKLALGTVNSLYPITISEVSAGKVYLNRGAGLGVEAGDTFTVYSQGSDIIDPDTKKSIGKIEEAVGDIVVQESLDKMAIAAVVSEGATITKGMICRINQRKPEPDMTPNENPSTSPSDDGRLSVAILPLQNSASADPKAINDLQTFFYTQMGQYPNVKLIERQQLDKVAQELNLTDDGYVSPETAIQVGKMTGAKYCMIGSLVRLDETSTESVLRDDLRMTLNRVSAEVDCRILETGKGEIYGRPAATSQVDERDAPASEVRSGVLRLAVNDLCQKLMGETNSTPQPSLPQGTKEPSGSTSEMPKNPEGEFAGSFLLISQFANGTGRQGGDVAEICQTLDSNLEHVLAQTKRIPMVERYDDRFLDELAFGKEVKGFVDPNTIPKTGKLIGAKYYLATRITRYEPTATGDNSMLPNVYENNWSLDLEIMGKLLEIETGQILETFQISKTLKGSNDSKSAMSSIPVDMLVDLNDRAAKEVTAQMTDRLIEVLFPVLIAHVTDTDIYLNQGESTNIRPGMKFLVEKKGENIIDKTTGRVIGQAKSRVGTITVTRVEREMAFAAPEPPAKIEEFAEGMECCIEKTAVADAQEEKSEGAASKGNPEISTAAAKNEIPKDMERVFALAPVQNDADAPGRALSAFRDGVSKGIKKAANTKVVTRDQAELAAIGREYLSGKSRLMDDKTRLKALNLAGCRYMVFLGISDWVSQISRKEIPMTDEYFDVQEVQLRASGKVVDLKTGEEICVCQAAASSAEDIDKAVTVDGQGDLDMDAKIAEIAAGRMVSEFREQGAFK